MESNFLIALVLVVLVVVGSVVWVRPSPRDKKLALWRQQTLLAGMKVKLEGFKAEPKESGIRADIEGASYQLFNHQPDKKDTLVWAVVKDQGWLKDHLPEDWSWYRQQADSALVGRIADLIREVPIDVIGIERTPYMSRIVWKEVGKEYDPAELKRFLDKVQAVA